MKAEGETADPYAIRYYVAYATGDVVGSIEMRMSLPIRSMADVNSMAQEIRRLNNWKASKPVVVTNWIRFPEGGAS